MIYDALILGSGIAGSTTAYLLAQQGLQVAVLSKNSSLEESNSFYAQGGIVYQGEKDSAELRYQDIMKAGAGICNPEAVQIISQEGPKAVKKILIDTFKVPFSKNSNKNLDLTDEGAHSVRRIIHSFDTTGRSIVESAIQNLKHTPNLHLLSDYTAIDIITSNHHSSDPMRVYKPSTALGVYAYQNKIGKVIKILARSVVLATGGMGQVYQHTSNPKSSTGDGFAMAARAGAQLINMEYTQFHPTTLYHDNGNNFLISESVRGEGAIIINKKGSAFMEKYHPLKDLAPRDIVTRAILNELQESGDSCVYLDLSPIEKEKIPVRFPHIYQTILNLGIDISSEPIPIVPAFHFSCGGIMTNMVGRTNIRHLYAAGEVACTGLHGANRLASTSLLEGLTFGQRVAKRLIEKREELSVKEFPDIPEWVDTELNTDVDPALINQDWTSLKSIMWNYVGAIRSKKRLQRAIVDLKNLKEDIENFYRNVKINRRLIELRNAVQTGLIIAEHAWENKKSIGSHYRVD